MNSFKIITISLKKNDYLVRKILDSVKLLFGRGWRGGNFLELTHRHLNVIFTHLFGKYSVLDNMKCNLSNSFLSYSQKHYFALLLLFYCFTFR